MEVHYKGYAVSVFPSLSARFSYTFTDELEGYDIPTMKPEESPVCHTAISEMSLAQLIEYAARARVSIYPKIRDSKKFQADECYIIM